MRTVLFEEGAEECPLVAIADFEPAEVASLRGEIARLTSGETSSVVLEGDVQLALQVGAQDVGIIRRGVPKLTCVLSSSAWRQVAPESQGRCAFARGSAASGSISGDSRLICKLSEGRANSNVGG